MIEFARYMADGFDQIDGWPGQKSSVQFMLVFKELFDHVHERGGVCEIGIHHAKYLIALHNILCPSNSLGIDLFEDQTRNFSDSGRGERAICEQNIAKYAYRPSSITLMSKDSLDLKADDLAAIVQNYGYFAMFSVDGGHSTLHSAYDFLTASKLTSGRGVIIMDDIFHPDWPGVTEGIYTALASKASPFVPLFITRKKLFLCHASSWNVYRQFVIDQGGDKLVKMVEFCAWSIPSLNFGTEY
jgi:hypothetical protein